MKWSVCVHEMAWLIQIDDTAADMYCMDRFEPGEERAACMQWLLFAMGHVKKHVTQ